MLDKLSYTNTDTVVENLKINMYALKTALLMPIEEFVDRNPDCKIEVETYLKYSPQEELYGLFLVIEKKNTLVFSYLWEDRGTLW